MDTRRHLTNRSGQIRKQLQLGSSSRAIHGGAYFSAIFGRNFNPTTVLRPSQPLACYWRVIFPALCHFSFVFEKYTVLKAAFQEDFFKNGQNGFLTSVILNFFLYLHLLQGDVDLNDDGLHHGNVKHHEVKQHTTSKPSVFLSLNYCNFAPVRFDSFRPCTFNGTSPPTSHPPWRSYTA